MKRFFAENAIFLSHCFVFLLCLGSLLCLMPKGDLHLALNGFHTAAGDVFFRYYTVVGEWVFYVIVALLLFYKLGAAVFLLSSNLLAGLFTQIIKRVVAAPRPSLYFDIANNPDILPIVEGVHLHAVNSFPSGHTATFFCLFFCLSIILNDKDIRVNAAWRSVLQYGCFVLAVLGAYSRIYLSQHFAADIFAGCVLALICTIALMPLFARWETKHPRVYNWRLIRS